jgi:hypothetical protein
MKLMAYHDLNGNILGLAVSPSEDTIPAEVIANTQPGIRVLKVDLPPGETLDFGNPHRLNQGLSHLLDNYNVDAGLLKRMP